MTTLTERDLIDKLASKTGVSEGTVEEVVGSLVGAIRELTPKGQPVKVGPLQIRHELSSEPVARPDSLFGAREIKRLGELMQKWRIARDNGRELDDAESSELNRLIDLEFEASAQRSNA